jgi:flagellar hook-length control protein FliK
MADAAPNPAAPVPKPEPTAPAAGVPPLPAPDPSSRVAALPHVGAVAPRLDVRPPEAAPQAAAGPSSLDAPITRVSPESPAATAVPRLARTAARLDPVMTERIAHVVRMQSARGGGRVRMLLHPPHLGAVKVEVAVRDGTVFAVMETENSAARQALQSHMKDLQQSLEGRGLTLGQMSVHVGHHGQSAAGPFPQSAPDPFSGDPAAEEISGARPAARSQGLLDVTA